MSNADNANASPPYLLDGDRFAAEARMLDAQGLDEAVEWVPIDQLKLTDSPRLGGEDPTHVRLLAETSEILPPILVHRRTMRVIDGCHRLRAAILRGAKTLPVRFVECAEDQVFLLAVQVNVKHGLPLSLTDRKAAAKRIIERYVEWSDRSIAAAVGLSADSVAYLRRTVSTGAEAVTATARIGKDGRVRPIDPTLGRLRAGRVLADRPHASLREIAREAGIAVSTARDVRERVRQGLNPVPVRRWKGEAGDAVSKTEGPEALRTSSTGVGSGEVLSALHSLRKDPSLRLSDAGRRVLRWLDGHALKPQDNDWVMSAVPPHCAVLIADVARHYAVMWHRFAETLEQGDRNAM